MERNSIRWMLMVLLAGSLAVSSSFAEETASSKPSETIPRPKDGTFIVDVANIIDPLNESEINNVLIALQEEHGVPLYVVVIPPLAEMGFGNSSIEEAAMELMETWKISPKTLDGKPWDRGVLFLISREEGKFNFRVETGKGWGTDLDKPALTVLERDMYPYFGKGKYSLGLSKGIRFLETAIRRQTPMRKTPPKIPTPKDDEYVIDTASLLPLEVKIAADTICRELYKDHGVPMFIVTALSMEAIARKGIVFEDITKRFYRFWPIGDEARREAFQDRGVLLFISRNDNLIGLKFGDAWGDKDARGRIRQDIMVHQIIPALKANQLLRAVMGGIQGVRNVVRNVKFPKPQAPATTAPSTNPTPSPQ